MMIDVLIVDDELWITEVIKNIIDWEKEGYNIMAVLNDGLDACNMILSRNPSIVLTDIRMPGMDGLTLIKKARQAGLETQFIIISGHNDFKYAKDALEYGAAGYLLKPIDQNELTDILDKVKNMILTKQNMEKKELSLKTNLEKCVKKLKEQFFLDYFNGLAFDLDIEEINNEFTLKFSKSKYRVMILSIDHIKEYVDYNKISGDIYEALLKNSVHQSCDEMIVIPHRKKFICILNYRPEMKTMVEKAIRNMFNQIKNDFGMYYDFTVCFGTEENHINAIKESYRNALNIFHSRIVLGVSCIYDDPAIKPKYVLKNLFPPEKEMKLKFLIEQMEIPDAKEVIDDILQILNGQSEANPLLVYCGAEHLIEIITTVSKSMGYEHAYIDGYLKEKKEQLEECANLEQVKALLFNMLDDMKDIRNSLNKSKNQKIVDSIKKYINEHYLEDINLNTLAEMVYLTPNYLSELFSREAGCTFKEYVIQSRMEMAKKLLGDLQYKTNEIANLVGYSDTKYFCKLFKKYIGLNPSEYRRLFF